MVRSILSCMLCSLLVIVSPEVNAQILTVRDQRTSEPLELVTILSTWPNVFATTNANGQADPDEIYDTKEQAVGAVSTGKYPSPPARDLYVVTKGQPSGLTAAFIEWILADGQQYIDETGYIALPAERLAEEVQKLK